MTMKLTVLVSGATGNQGGAVTQALLASGHKVRALTRNTEPSRARRLAEQGVDDEAPVDLTEADIRRWTVAPVPVQANLRLAMDTMRANTVEAVWVYQRSANSGKRILHGVVTRESIEKFSLAKL